MEGLSVSKRATQEFNTQIFNLRTYRTLSG